MDKELALLEDWAVEQIIEWKEYLEKKTRATGKAPSDLKRALRFGNELVFNPEAYGDLLEKARSQGMSAKEIIQEIRKVETRLLDSKKVLMSDWLHHRTAQRTGGDTFLYMRGDARRAARSILRGEGIFLGNIDENFVSLPGILHTKKTQGVEQQWYNSLTQDQKTGLYLPTELGGSGLTPAHMTGASSAKISGTAPTPGLLTPEEGASFVRESALLQRKETAAAERQMFESGYVEEARKQTGLSNLYTQGGPTKVIISPEQAVPIYNRLLNFNGGNVTLNRAALTALAAGGVAALGPLGTAASAAELAGRAQVAQETGGTVDQLQVGLAGASFAGDIASYFPPAAPIGEAVSTVADVANIGIDVYREDPERAKQFIKQQVKKAIPKPPVVQQVQQVQRAAQAIQRGGKLKFGLGGVKITLPEFGLSELMGLN